MAEHYNDDLVPIEVRSKSMWYMEWSADDLFWIIRDNRNLIVKRCYKKAEAEQWLDQADLAAEYRLQQARKRKP